MSLLYPWAPPPIGADMIDRLAEALNGVGPLDITFSEVGRFQTVLWLRPEPEGEIRAIARRLAAAFPEYPPYGGAFSDPQPPSDGRDLGGSAPAGAVH